MNTVFLDDNLNAQFYANGYVILKNKLHLNFNETYQFFNSLDSKVDNDFYSAIWSSNQSFRKIIDEKIKEILTPVCVQYLKNYKPFFSDLLVKKPSLFKKLHWHQDWTFIDEKKNTSVFIWCPLQKVTKRNGCMMVLPKSQDFFYSIRGSNIATGLNQELLNKLEKKYAHYLELEESDILIFNQSMLHASLPNRSFHNRLSIGLYCVPEKEQVYHYHYDYVEKKYLQYLIDTDFILHFSDQQDFKKNIHDHKMPKPNGKVIQEFNELNPPFNENIYKEYENYLIKNTVQ